MKQTEERQTSLETGHAGGFSLIELLIALTIFSIGLLGIAGLQLSAIKGNISAKHLNRSAVLASDQMERLLAMPYASIRNGSADVSEGEKTFSLSWTVTAPADKDYKSIEVICGPKTTSGDTPSRGAVTMKAAKVKVD
ncbi:MAG: hypothetical protein CSA22_06980 [Deltaproteobacteria bacterium]|nr:MAG: hypothetical protein CSA22_06980 [Deltaproteobacteria bacterium]